MPYIGVSPSNGVRQTYDYTATAGQTSFSGSDNNSQTLAYTDSAYIDVYQNGVLLIPSDYTATTGTTVVLDTGATVSDTLQIVVYDVFSVADTVSASDGGSFGGNVGVGGTLAVTGNSTFSGEIITSTSGTSNVRIGENAGDAIASGGNYNVVVGDEAGTALTTGDDNVAVGYAALKTEDAHGRNTAIGYEALEMLNAGVDGENVAVGYRAGEELTEGIQNTLIGTQAGDSLTHADYNVAVGRNALTTDTLGHKSVAIGVGALASQNFTSSTDSNNVAIGYDAGGYVTTGTSNTIVGASAAQDLTTGGNNVVIGNRAGEEMTSANDNVFIGRVSGGAEAGAATTGDDNICIGSGTGGALTSGGANILVGDRAGDAITTGNNNIIMGQLAGTHVNDSNGSYNLIIGHFNDTSSTSVDHEMVIGYNVTGQGANNFTFGNSTTDSNIAFGATSISAPSDERYKEEVTTSTAGLSFINDLRPVTFKWKKEKDIPTDHKAYVKDSDTRVMGRGETLQHGFIAQEVKTAIDNHSEIKDGFDMWMEDPNDGRQRIADGALIPMLVKAIQELSAEVKALKGE